jgi:hypothetical protein
MSKRKLLGTVFLIAPLALAGCADPGGEFAEGMDTTDFMAANDGAHELGVIHFQAGDSIPGRQLRSGGPAFPDRDGP